MKNILQLVGRVFYGIITFEVKIFIMDKETVNYIINYYSHLLSDKEKIAIKHTITGNKFNIQNQSQNQLATNFFKENDWISEDETVLNLLKDGYDTFELNTAKRVVEENQDKIFYNNCPKCNKLARTPFAKQCRFCGNDWH